MDRKKSSKRSAKRKFFQWAVKWFYDDDAPPEQENCSPDVPQIFRLLHSMGFRLRRVDFGGEDIKSEGSEIECGCRVAIRCVKSGLRVIMVSDTKDCNCPDTKEEDSGQFWEVSSIVPIGSQNQLNQSEASGSSLFPKLEPGFSEVVEELLKQIITIINEENANVQPLGPTPLASSLSQLTVSGVSYRHSMGSTQTHYRSLDTLMAQNLEIPPGIFNNPQSSMTKTDGDEITIPSLERQKTWSTESTSTSSICCDKRSPPREDINISTKLDTMVQHAMKATMHLTDILDSIQDSLTADPSQLGIKPKTSLHALKSKKKSSPLKLCSKISEGTGNKFGYPNIPKSDQSKAKIKRPSNFTAALLQVAKKSNRGASVGSSTSTSPYSLRSSTPPATSSPNIALSNSPRVAGLPTPKAKSSFSSKLGTPSSKLGTPSSKLGTPSSKLGTPSSKLGTPTSKLSTSFKLGSSCSKIGTPSSKLSTPSTSSVRKIPKDSI